MDGSGPRLANSEARLVSRPSSTRRLRTALTVAASFVIFAAIAAVAAMNKCFSSSMCERLSSSEPFLRQEKTAKRVVGERCFIGVVAYF